MKPEEMIAQAMRPIQKPQQQEEEKPGDTSVGSSMMNNSAISAVGTVKQEPSSILNIPAEALSNFNSVGQPQRPPTAQQQMM
jgi:hypothetical protein